MKQKKILFVTLRTFSLVGGIEKVCKALSFALQSLALQKLTLYKLYALYDDSEEQAYISSQNFKAFHGKLSLGISKSIWEGIQSQIIILSHINLALIGLIVKIISPKTKVILWTHGIEIWRPLSFIQKVFLSKADQIIAVSEFTKSIIINTHYIEPHKINVIPNCLDPLFKFPQINNQEPIIEQTSSNAPYLVVLCRLSVTEKNKNYDQIIAIIGELKQEGILLNYKLCGKYQTEEFERIKKIAKEHNIEEQIILTGFVDDLEIEKIYADAVAFVMPSTKEGFGLVFIEAQAHGLPVICGNKDGSIETLKHPLAGFAIDPADRSEIKKTILGILKKPLTKDEKFIIQNKCKENFGYQTFERHIHNLVS